MSFLSLRSPRSGLLSRFTISEGDEAVRSDAREGGSSSTAVSSHTASGATALIGSTAPSTGFCSIATSIADASCVIGFRTELVSSSEDFVRSDSFESEIAPDVVESSHDSIDGPPRTTEATADGCSSEAIISFPVSTSELHPSWSGGGARAESVGVASAEANTEEGSSDCAIDLGSSGEQVPGGESADSSSGAELTLMVGVGCGCTGGRGRGAGRGGRGECGGEASGAR